MLMLSGKYVHFNRYAKICFPVSRDSSVQVVVIIDYVYLMETIITSTLCSPYPKSTAIFNRHMIKLTDIGLSKNAFFSSKKASKSFAGR